MSEDKRYEFIDGEFFMVPSPNESHQRISRELEYALLSYVKKNKSGFVYDAPFDVVFLMKMLCSRILSMCRKNEKTL